MIKRYTRPAMGAIWTDENKYRCWLRVETAASETLAEAGVVPQEAARAIRERGGFDLARIEAIEAEVKHDVIAFTTAVAEKIGPEARWLHYGLTSNDRARVARDLVDLARFDAAAEGMRVGKLSGAVGTFGHLKPEHEEAICAKLGLAPAAVATQVLQRDRHAAYIATLAIVCSTLDKIATEVRHLQRTEVREAEEFFSEKQKGSSAMPHKRNPIASEQISGLARVVRANAQAAFENIALWHERDISHSSVERVILPDSTILTDYLLAKTAGLVENLLVYPKRMLRNLESTGGLIFSGQLLLDLAESGMAREDAYRLVQAHAMRAWKEELVFRDLVAADREITGRLPPEKLAQPVALARPLGNVAALVARVLAGA